MQRRENPDQTAAPLATCFCTFGSSRILYSRSWDRMMYRLNYRLLRGNPRRIPWPDLRRDRVIWQVEFDIGSPGTRPRLRRRPAVPRIRTRRPEWFYLDIDTGRIASGRFDCLRFLDCCQARGIGMMATTTFYTHGPRLRNSKTRTLTVRARSFPLEAGTPATMGCGRG